MAIVERNTDIQPGYKRTEVGVIPADWTVKPLGEIASVSSGGTPNRSNPNYWNGDVPWITTTQINFDLIDTANEFITKKGLENSAARVYPPRTLLMAMYGQGKTRGRMAILAISAAINQACAAIKLSREVSNQYIFFNLSNRYEEIRKLSNTGNQENLNSAIIKSILIPIPNDVKEQQAIANTLSDIDALITSLNKLIAKKRDIKQATMQQLLMGKTRLPEFSRETKPIYKQTEVGMIPEDWEVRELIELTTLLTNGFVGKATDFYTDSDDGVIYIQGFNVEENSFNLTGIKRVTLDFHKQHSKSHLLEGDLLTVQTGEIGLTTIIPSELKGSNCHALIISRFKKNFDPKYFSYYFNSFNGRMRFKEIETGSTMKHLNVGDLQTWLVPFPPNKAEQSAIATILSDMDAEIAALEQRREKTRALKQGMMQELLTGKTRLQ